MKTLFIFILMLFIFNVSESKFRGSTKHGIAIKDEPFHMTCKSNSTILYCWFLSPNGTSYSLIPNTISENYEYYGEGLSSGDCGMKVKSASPSDEGTWHCNMGTNTVTDDSTRIVVTVYDTPLIAKMKVVSIVDDVLMCNTYDNSPLEYCRFIRPDGLGIYPTASSNNYSAASTNLSMGQCHLKLNEPKSYDVGVWTCAGKSKLQKDAAEYYDTITVQNYYRLVIYSNGLIVLAWIMFVITACMLCLILTATIHKRRVSNRRSQNPPPYSPPTGNALPEKIPLP